MRVRVDRSDLELHSSWTLDRRVERSLDMPRCAFLLHMEALY